MNIRPHPDAEAEITEAFERYREISVDLGRDFLARFESALAVIRHNPNQGAFLRPPVRRVLLKRFPYLLVYLVKADEIFLVAVPHKRRRPFYWRLRLEE